MADVFISYSRKDQAFVRRLFQALTEDRRGVWVDWEGIPVTADWWQEIRTGIEACSSKKSEPGFDAIDPIQC
jgi:hypothetical protein